MFSVYRLVGAAERDWRKQKRDPLINHFPPLYFYGFLDKISYRTDTVSNSITTSHFHFFRVLDLPPIGTNSPPKVAHVSKPAFQPSLLTRRRTLSSYIHLKLAARAREKRLVVGSAAFSLSLQHRLLEPAD